MERRSRATRDIAEEVAPRRHEASGSLYEAPDNDASHAKYLAKEIAEDGDGKYGAAFGRPAKCGGRCRRRSGFLWLSRTPRRALAEPETECGDANGNADSRRRNCCARD
jgi:hypothetical protein